MHLRFAVLRALDSPVHQGRGMCFKTGLFGVEVYGMKSHTRLFLATLTAAVLCAIALFAPLAHAQQTLGGAHRHGHRHLRRERSGHDGDDRQRSDQAHSHSRHERHRRLQLR